MNLQKSSFRFQEQDGWCGPAALQMLFLNEQINLTQKQIADSTYDASWGTPHENLYSFAKKYFTGVNVYSNTTLNKIEEKINDGNLVMVNIVTDNEDKESGHYVAIQCINLKTEKLVVFDPDGEDGGIYEIDTKVFETQWFDYATEHDLRNNIKTKHWALVIDPKTRKNPLPNLELTS